MKIFFIAIMFLFWANSVLAQQSCQNSCSHECILVAQDILSRCGGASPTPPPPQPNPYKTALYHSDSCGESDLIVNLRSGTDCSSNTINSAPRTWGVKVRGTCHDISDVESDIACVKYKAASSSYATLFYHSDRCQESELIAAVDESTDCEALARAENDSVWGVVIDGQCIDISDTGMKAACERYKN